MITGEALINLFGACKHGRCLAQLHSLAIKAGTAQDTFFATKLINHYAKFAPLPQTRKLFDETPHRPVHIWNCLLKCYCKEGHFKQLLSLFSHFFSFGKPDLYTISIALQACARLKALDFGKTVHGFFNKSYQNGRNLFIGSALVELYSKCGRMDEALRVFEEFSEPDTVLWTTMITGYEQNGEPDKAFNFFTRMATTEGIVLDPITLVTALSACAQIFNLNGGRCIHGYMIRVGFNSSLPLSNSLLSLYGKMGLVNDAFKLFEKMEEKDVISWGSMISCYAHHGRAMEALDLFNEMVANGIEPNSVVLIGTLQACEATCNLEEGKRIHKLARKYGLDSDILLSTALIDMYMNCSSPCEAVEVFDRMPEKDAVCYTSLLHGCVRNGMMYKSIEIFYYMLASGIRPDAVDLVKVMNACSELGVLQQIICIHGFAIRFGLNNNCFLGSAFIESYTKCGSLDCALAVFTEIEDKDIVVWSSMCAGYGFHGKGQEAIHLFNNMIKHSSVSPNDVFFVSLLSSCSHAGLFKEGIEIYNTMVNEYKLIPNSKHYGIMVDLLGRTGELEKAVKFIGQIPEPVRPDVWGALLGACSIYENMELGEVVSKKLDLSDAGNWILLSNMYAVDKKWDCAAEIRQFVKEKQLKKVLGQSVIELRNEECNFVPLA